jgi:dsRNA-specific ribonuclease
VGSRELGAGEGRSKKAAEQLAAKAAWQTIIAESGLPATPGSAG